MSDSWDDLRDKESQDLGESEAGIENTAGPDFDESWDAEEPRISRRKRRQDRESRGNWYLLTGLILGLGIGLLFAWVISPVKYADTEPAKLADPYKDEYRRVIALSYHSDQDLNRARERLNLIDSGNLSQALAAQAQRMLAEKRPPEEASALAALAADLGRPAGAKAPSQAVAEASLEATIENPSTPTTSGIAATEVSAAIQTPTLPPPTLTPTITLTPAPSFTPNPTATPLPISNAAFALKSKREICNGSLQAGLLQIQVNDADQNPLPGVRIVITWQDGQDTFITGLAPEINPGYADFIMSPEVTYRLKVGEASDMINDLKIGQCGGGWTLTFEEGSKAR